MSVPTQEQQTLSTPSLQIEEADLFPLQDGSATGMNNFAQHYL